MVNFRRYGSIIAWGTVVVASFDAVITLVAGSGNDFTAFLGGVTVVGVGTSILDAIAVALTENRWAWAVIPVAGGVLGIAMTLAGTVYGPAFVAVAFLGSLATFVAEKSEPVWQRVVIRLFAGVGFGALIAGGNGGLKPANSMVYAGIFLAVLALALAIVALLRSSNYAWIALLLLVSATGAVLPRFAPVSGELLFLPMASITFIHGLTSATDATDRPVFGLLGLFSVILIVVGGTMIGGVLGLVAFPETTTPYRLGVDLYLVAGALSVFAWVLAVVRAARYRMWGWLIVSFILVNIGALMYGLFGPTLADYHQTRDSRRLRRAAGA